MSALQKRITGLKTEVKLLENAQKEIDRLKKELETSKRRNGVLNTTLKKYEDSNRSLKKARPNGGAFIVQQGIEKHFARLGIDYKIFSLVFDADDVLLTGSIVLMQLIGEWWLSDIDLVVSSDSLEDVLEFFQEEYKIDFEEVDKDVYFEAILKDKFYKDTRLFKGFLNGVKVDIIVASKETTPRKIVKCFDFAFCRNYFNGVDITCIDCKSVRTKTCQVFSGGDYKYSNARIEKYRLRGFVVNKMATTPTASKTALKFKTVTKKHMKKYATSSDDFTDDTDPFESEPTCAKCNVSFCPCHCGVVARQCVCQIKAAPEKEESTVQMPPVLCKMCDHYHKLCGCAKSSAEEYCTCECVQEDDLTFESDDDHPSKKEIV